jgi:hypothetical protein
MQRPPAKVRIVRPLNRLELQVAAFDFVSKCIGVLPRRLAYKPVSSAAVPIGLDLTTYALVELEQAFVS